MKLNFLKLLLLLFLGNTYAQLNPAIKGTWVAVKTELQDGSRVIGQAVTDTLYKEFTITDTKLIMNSQPVFRDEPRPADFNFKDNFLRFTPTSGYAVEEVTANTLILNEKMDGTTAERSKKYYLVRPEYLISQYKEQYKNRKNIRASFYFTPKLPKGIEALGKNFKTDIANLRMSGSLKLYPKEKKAKATVTFSTKADSTRINKLTDLLDASFDSWDLTHFEEYDSVEIPFIFELKASSNFHAYILVFLKEDVKAFDTFYGTKMEDIREAAALFSKGLEAYQKKNYAKAIAYFDKSYDLDKKNIDAIYNKALMYYESGDMPNACKTWREIMELGQVPAKTIYEEKCK